MENLDPLKARCISRYEARCCGVGVVIQGYLIFADGLMCLCQGHCSVMSHNSWHL